MLDLLHLAPAHVQPVLLEVLFAVHAPNASFAHRAQCIEIFLRLLDCKLNQHRRLANNPSERATFSRQVRKLLQRLELKGTAAQLRKKEEIMTMYMLSTHVGIVPVGLWKKALSARPEFI